MFYTQYIPKRFAITEADAIFAADLRITRIRFKIPKVAGFKAYNMQLF